MPRATSRLPIPSLIAAVLLGGSAAASETIGANQVWLSDLAWTSATSGWGPIEKDRSNGEASAGDGHVITIGGTTYPKGLGVHAGSDVSFALNAAYTTFQTDVGVDDEVGSRGTVVFQVYVDGTKRYDSGVVGGAQGHLSASVDVTNATVLRLVVTNAGDNVYFDHSDWAGANLTKVAPKPPAPTAPTALKATATSTSTIALAWGDASTNETGFKVQRSTDGKTFVALATTAANATSYNDAGLAATTTYSYRVAATNAGGDSAFTTVASAKTLTQAGTTYAGPVVISAGGTYSGNWQTSGGKAAITIATSAPVTIRDSNVKGTGDLITTTADHCRLSVLNTSGLGTDPGADTRFIDVENWNSLLVDHCTLTTTSGIYAAHYAGDHSAAQTVIIRNCSALDITGDANDLLQFFQMNHDQGLIGSEIAWNQVLNEPGKSQVEDNISIYESSGTSASPIRIHDNYIQGGYARNPVGNDYSGGGIMAGDGNAGLSGWIEVSSNQVVSTSNYGIAISSGHDSSLHDNRILSCGLLPDGRKIPYQNVGLYIWDSYHIGRMSGDTARNNQIGWVLNGGRNDAWTPDAASSTGMVDWPGSLTLATEATELQVWKSKLSGNGQTVGAKH